ncbi:hypothetical protein CCUS01_06137 [Colletotrichum cuscutae]|uniref:Uncharacterized protein n=1 Tax=Colletotrichum cuscutae TaxID=1209917 RepID=A0AAI9VAN6_9PEZI|nr:hypothetical protein CCUS01_06137 [Colletotrichum cuscutae]
METTVTKSSVQCRSLRYSAVYIERTLSHPGPTIFENRLLLRSNVLEIPQQTTGLSTAGDPAQLLLDGEASVVTVWNLGKTEYQNALNIHDTGAGSAAISLIVDAPRGASTYRHQGLHAVVDLLSTNHNIIVAVTSSGYGPKQLGQRSMGGKVEGWQSTDWSHVDDFQACRSVLDEVLLCSKRSPRKDLQNASCRRPTAGKPLQ